MMTDEAPEARLYVDVMAAMQDEPLFVGSLAEACRIIWALVPLARAHARIVTAAWTYAAAEIEDMRREDEEEV